MRMKLSNTINEASDNNYRKLNIEPILNCRVKKRRRKQMNLSESLKYVIIIILVSITRSTTAKKDKSTKTTVIAIDNAGSGSVPIPQPIPVPWPVPHCHHHHHHHIKYIPKPVLVHHWIKKSKTQNEDGSHNQEASSSSLVSQSFSSGNRGYDENPELFDDSPPLGLSTDQMSNPIENINNIRDDDDENQDANPSSKSYIDLPLSSAESLHQQKRHHYHSPTSNTQKNHQQRRKSTPSPSKMNSNKTSTKFPNTLNSKSKNSIKLSSSDQTINSDITKQRSIVKLASLLAANSQADRDAAESSVSYDTLNVTNKDIGNRATYQFGNNSLLVDNDNRQSGSSFEFESQRGTKKSEGINFTKQGHVKRKYESKVDSFEKLLEQENLRAEFEAKREHQRLTNEHQQLVRAAIDAEINNPLEHQPQQVFHDDGMMMPIPHQHQQPLNFNIDPRKVFGMREIVSSNSEHHPLYMPIFNLGSGNRQHQKHLHASPNPTIDPMLSAMSSIQTQVLIPAEQRPDMQAQDTSYRQFPIQNRQALASQLAELKSIASMASMAELLARWEVARLTRKHIKVIQSQATPQTSAKSNSITSRLKSSFLPSSRKPSIKTDAPANNKSAEIDAELKTKQSLSKHKNEEEVKSIEMAIQRGALTLQRLKPGIVSPVQVRRNELTIPIHSLNSMSDKSKPLNSVKQNPLLSFTDYQTKQKSYNGNKYREAHASNLHPVIQSIDGVTIPTPSSSVGTNSLIDGFKSVSSNSADNGKKDSLDTSVLKKQFKDDNKFSNYNNRHPSETSVDEMHFYAPSAFLQNKDHNVNINQLEFPLTPEQWSVAAVQSLNKGVVLGTKKLDEQDKHQAQASLPAELSWLEAPVSQRPEDFLRVRPSLGTQPSPQAIPLSVALGARPIPTRPQINLGESAAGIGLQSAETSDLDNLIGNSQINGLNGGSLRSASQVSLNMFGNNDPNFVSATTNTNSTQSAALPALSSLVNTNAQLAQQVQQLQARLPQIPSIPNIPQAPQIPNIPFPPPPSMMQLAGLALPFAMARATRQSERFRNNQINAAATNGGSNGPTNRGLAARTRAYIANTSKRLTRRRPSSAIGTHGSSGLSAGAAAAAAAAQHSQALAAAAAAATASAVAATTTTTVTTTSIMKPPGFGQKPVPNRVSLAGLAQAVLSMSNVHNRNRRNRRPSQPGRVSHPPIHRHRPKLDMSSVKASRRASRPVVVSGISSSQHQPDINFHQHQQMHLQARQSALPTPDLLNYLLRIYQTHAAELEASNSLIGESSASPVHIANTKNSINQNLPAIGRAKFVEVMNEFNRQQQQQGLRSPQGKPPFVYDSYRDYQSLGPLIMLAQGTQHNQSSIRQPTNLYMQTNEHRPLHRVIRSTTTTTTTTKPAIVSNQINLMLFTGQNLTSGDLLKVSNVRQTDKDLYSNDDKMKETVSSSSYQNTNNKAGLDGPESYPSSLNENNELVWEEHQNQQQNIDGPAKEEPVSVLSINSEEKSNNSSDQQLDENQHQYKNEKIKDDEISNSNSIESEPIVNQANDFESNKNNIKGTVMNPTNDSRSVNMNNEHLHTNEHNTESSLGQQNDDKFKGTTSSDTSSMNDQQAIMVSKHSQDAIDTESKKSQTATHIVQNNDIRQKENAQSNQEVYQANEDRSSFSQVITGAPTLIRYETQSIKSDKPITQQSGRTTTTKSTDIMVEMSTEPSINTQAQPDSKLQIGNSENALESTWRPSIVFEDAGMNAAELDKKREQISLSSSISSTIHNNHDDILGIRQNLKTGKLAVRSDKAAGDKRIVEEFKTKTQIVENTKPFVNAIKLLQSVSYPWPPPPPASFKNDVSKPISSHDARAK